MQFLLTGVWNGVFIWFDVTNLKEAEVDALLEQVEVGGGYGCHREAVDRDRREAEALLELLQVGRWWDVAEIDDALYGFHSM